MVFLVQLIVIHLVKKFDFYVTPIFTIMSKKDHYGIYKLPIQQQ